jgi:hypothetical protein
VDGPYVGVKPAANNAPALATFAAFAAFAAGAWEAAVATRDPPVRVGVAVHLVGGDGHA